MRKYWVYVHTCPNGKKYVGCTKQARPELRWKEGNGYRYNKHFYSAILKYGWDNIEHEVFEVESEEEMYRKEVELISFYHSNDPEYGYNNSVGGEHSSLGCTRSEECRKKISETKKKRCNDPEYRKKLSEAEKKRYSDHPEIRKKISEAHKGKTFSEEHRKKLSESHKGKPCKPHKPVSEETRKKMSEAKKGKLRGPRSEETRKKISEAHRGKTMSEEARKKMSEAHKGRTLSEETKKKMSEIQKNKPRIKISLPDGTVLEVTKQNLTKYYINKGKKFEYVS